MFFQFVRRHMVGGGALLAPFAGPDLRAAQHRVGIDRVDADAELGAFQRTVTLPAVVDVDRVQSAYSGGILAVTLPKRARKGRVTISITPGA